MQTVTAALQTEQARTSELKYYRKVELYRRYWTGSAYAWRAALNIDAYVVKVSTAKWKFESRGFGEWKSPSFQVDVSNPRNVWSQVEATSIFGTDQVELSRVRVRMGHTLPDGTEEDVYVFGGVINRPIAWREEKRQALLNVICKKP